MKEIENNLTMFEIGERLYEFFELTDGAAKRIFIEGY
jgi:hypothetical protein